MHKYAIIYRKRKTHMSLILHCGARKTDKDEVMKCEAPESTLTHQPIEHSYLIGETERLIKKSDLLIKEEVFAMTKDTMRMFAMYQLESPSEDYSTTVGIRNSNDKKFAAGAVIGTNTTVCDNLLFHGEYKMWRKHTKYIYEYLSELLESFVSNIPEFQIRREDEIELLKGSKITQDQAHRFIIEGAKQKIIPPSQILKVVDEWDNPGCTVKKDYGVFKEHGRSLWRMQNAFTTALHNNKNIFNLPEKTMKLNRSLKRLVA